MVNFNGSGTGYCSVHGSVTVAFTSNGTVNVEAEGKPLVKIGTRGIASCGHSTTQTTAGSRIGNGANGLSRVGDTGVVDVGGSYTITNSGMGTVLGDHA